MLSSKTLEVFILGLGMCALACERGPDGSSEVDQSMYDETGNPDPDAGDEIGDGDGDLGDGEGAGEGDADGGEGEGDADGGEGVGDGDGDGDEAGDGDGDEAGDGDGDGDGDEAGDGDGDEADDGDPELCASVCGTPGCGKCPDAAMIDAQWFFIDPTEVTVGDYIHFAVLEFDSSVLSPECSWKPQVGWFEPNEWNAQLAGDWNKPIAHVDWCDAQAYCSWAGKRLCGTVGGGPAALDEINKPPDEWYRACTAGGLLVYPYGNNYKKFACNGTEQDLAAATPVGSLAGCEGGLAGLFDMSGNVWEWTNSCGEEPGLQPWEQDCRRRGGSFYSNKDILRCGIDSRRHRGYRSDNTGIRCCSG
ncbi:MAG: SUMF1/EgtB/PvdO family nonheme iron enzyme [Enhygromyxa sp.]